jgi:hypothetical protein
VAVRLDSFSLPRDPSWERLRADPKVITRRVSEILTHSQAFVCERMAGVQLDLGPFSRNLMFERTNIVHVRLSTQPASGDFNFLGEGEFSRYAILCQICARELLIWTF